MAPLRTLPPAGTEAPFDVRRIEPLLAAQAAAGTCTWPWLVGFLRSLTRAVRVSARFFPPHRVDGVLEAHGQETPPAAAALLGRQDDDLAAAVHREGRAIHRKTVLNDEPLLQLGTPLSGPGEPIGALILWIRPLPDQALEPYLVALQLTAGFGQAAQRGTPGGDPHLAAALCALSVRLAESRTDRLQAFADATVRLTGGDAVAVAVGDRGRRRPVSVSGCARFDRAGALAAAVGETLRDLDLSADSGAVQSSGAALAREWDCRAVKAWFLPGAAFLIGFRQSEVAAAELDRRLAAAAPAWTALMAVSGRLGTGGAVRELLRPLASARGLLTILLCVALTAAMFVKIPYTIRAAARVEAGDRRTVASPYEGTLKINRVELGQEVKAGDVLGEMDGTELKIRLSEVQASLERARAQYAAIMSRGDADPGRAQLARLDAETAEIEIRLLEHRLQGLALTAPISGTVLRESSRLAGARIPLGMSLYEIAPAQAIRLEWDLPDASISYAREGQELTVTLDSFPGRTWRVRITRIHPQSEVRDGANLFVIEAEPKELPAVWKPGMKGRATLDTGPRTIGWILFHPVREFVEWILF